MVGEMPSPRAGLRMRLKLPSKLSLLLLRLAVSVLIWPVESIDHVHIHGMSQWSIGFIPIKER